MKSLRFGILPPELLDPGSKNYRKNRISLILSPEISPNDSNWCRQAIMDKVDTASAAEYAHRMAPWQAIFPSFPRRAHGNAPI
jgi:hypothetical protein